MSDAAYVHGPHGTDMEKMFKSHWGWHGLSLISLRKWDQNEKSSEFDHKTNCFAVWGIPSSVFISLSHLFHRGGFRGNPFWVTAGLFRNITASSPFKILRNETSCKYHTRTHTHIYIYIYIGTVTSSGKCIHSIKKPFLFYDWGNQVDQRNIFLNY